MRQEIKTPLACRYCPEDLQSPDYLKVHPMGQVPAMSYGDIHMWESGAIVEFLLGVLPSGTLRQPLPGTKEQAKWLQAGSSVTLSYALPMPLQQSHLRWRAETVHSELISLCVQFFHFTESLMTPVQDLITHTSDRADVIPQIVEEARPRLGELCSTSSSSPLQSNFVDQRTAVISPSVSVHPCLQLSAWLILMASSRTTSISWENTSVQPTSCWCTLLPPLRP